MTRRAGGGRSSSKQPRTSGESPPGNLVSKESSHDTPAIEVMLSARTGGTLSCMT